MHVLSKSVKGIIFVVLSVDVEAVFRHIPFTSVGRVACVDGMAGGRRRRLPWRDLLGLVFPFVSGSAQPG